MGKLQVVECETAADLLACFRIRHEVFCGEQGVTFAEELVEEDLDPRTHHLCGKLTEDCAGMPAGTVVAVARIIGSPGHLHLGRIAVARSARGLGLGRELLAGAHTWIAANYPLPQTVALSAQADKLGFYERCGYRLLDTPEYLDARILHRDMDITIATPLLPSVS